MSSTTVKLFWDIHGSQEYIEGFYIRYRDMTSDETNLKYNMVTIMNMGSTHVLADLNKFTKYEIFMVPFYKSVDGRPSNTRTVETLEDVPSAYPESFNAKLINLTTVILSWSQLPSNHINGKLLGYNIYLYGNGSAIHSNITTNASTNSISLFNLTPGAIYSARILAFNQVGAGPFSSPISIRMEPDFIKSNIDDEEFTANSLNTSYFDAKQTWFLVGVICTIIFAISLVVFAIFLRRKMSCKKSVSTHLTMPLQKVDEVGRNGFNGNVREALWINHGWRQTDKDTKIINNCSSDISNGYSSAFVADYCSVGNAPDYAEVDTHNLTTFYKKEYLTSIPEPYATTTLINTQSKHSNPNREHKSSGSEEIASRKSEKHLFDHNDDGAMEHLLSGEHHAKSPSDSGSYTTDEYGMPIRKPKHSNKSNRQINSSSFRPSQLTSGNSSKAPIVNWTDLIPPPPENPPSECGTPPATPNANNNCMRNGGNRMIRVQVSLILIILSTTFSTLFTYPLDYLLIIYFKYIN